MVATFRRWISFELPTWLQRQEEEPRERSPRSSGPSGLERMMTAYTDVLFRAYHD